MQKGAREERGPGSGLQRRGTRPTGTQLCALHIQGLLEGPILPACCPLGPLNLGRAVWIAVWGAQGLQGEKLGLSSPEAWAIFPRGP